jgi:hypothetical protein
MEQPEVIELSADEVRQLRKRHPRLASRRRVVVVALDDDPVAEAVAAIEGATSIVVRKPASWEQARRNLAMRERILAEFGALTPAELGQWATPRAANAHQYGSRLRKAGRAFSVPFQGKQLFPGFQFDAEGKPVAGLADILAALRPRFGDSDWSVASWFTSPNAHLPGKAQPADLLAKDAEAVLAAAKTGGRREVG